MIDIFKASHFISNLTVCTLAGHQGRNKMDRNSNTVKNDIVQFSPSLLCNLSFWKKKIGYQTEKKAHKIKYPCCKRTFVIVTGRLFSTGIKVFEVKWWKSRRGWNKSWCMWDRQESSSKTAFITAQMEDSADKLKQPFKERSVSLWFSCFIRIYHAI